MLILGRPDVEALLDLDALNDALGAAMSDLSAGACSRCGILRAGARRSRRRLRDNLRDRAGRRARAERWPRDQAIGIPPPAAGRRPDGNSTTNDPLSGSPFSFRDVWLSSANT